jgi:hypothetical protein
MSYQSIRSFRHRDLRGQDLSGYRALTPHDLAGADLLSAKLPKHIEFSRLIDRANESSHSMQKLIILIETVCIYMDSNCLH